MLFIKYLLKLFEIETMICFLFLSAKIPYKSYMSTYVVLSIEGVCNPEFPLIVNDVCDDEKKGLSSS